MWNFGAVWYVALIMLVVIRITQGSQVGVCRALMPGQRALIGCGISSHFAVEDSSIGDPQFLLKNGRTGVTVENVSEAAFLFVNGLRSTNRRLADGDVISVGGLEFMVEIRGETGNLGHLNLPLVGSVQFSDMHGLSVRLSQTMEHRTGGSRITIHPEFWSESIRLRNRGTGIPTLKMLQNISRRRPCGVVVNDCAVKALLSLDGISEKRLVPILSDAQKEPTLWILDSLSIPALHQVITELWRNEDVLFFVPVDATPRYRHRFANSTLWTSRTVQQLTTLLMAGSITLRESVFRFLDAVLLPAASPDPSWILLSTVRIDTESEPARRA